MESEASFCAGRRYDFGLVAVFMNILHNGVGADICCGGGRNTIRNIVTIQIPAQQNIIGFLPCGSANEFCCWGRCYLNNFAIAVIEGCQDPFVAIEHGISVVPAGVIIIPTGIIFFR